MRYNFGLVILTLVLIALVSTVQAATIRSVSETIWWTESGARLKHYYYSDDASTLCTQIVLDTSSIGGIIREPLIPFPPPGGCTVSGWDTPQLTISCSPGFPSGSYLTEVLMEDAGGTHMDDFVGATITATYTGSDCIFSGIFDNDVDFSYVYVAEYTGTCGGPINTPEFPSVVLPAALIIGFLGAVLLIQRTREQ